MDLTRRRMWLYRFGKIEPIKVRKNGEIGKGEGEKFYAGFSY
jgi:hypothetical protein